jgi:hypothetical protein
MQHVFGDEFAIGQPASVFRDHAAVVGAQAVCGDIEPLCRLGDQQCPRLRSRVLDRNPAVVRRVAAGGVAFIGGQFGVRGDYLQRSEDDIELLGGDLLERGLEALSQFRLAGEDRDESR